MTDDTQDHAEQLDDDVIFDGLHGIGGDDDVDGIDPDDPERVLSDPAVDPDDLAPEEAAVHVIDDGDLG
jgi:hypothetical protein